MRKIFVLLIFFLITDVPVFAEVPIMPVGEVRPGMKGYGKTVFCGTRVENFPITVLGVIKKYLAGTDLILIRIDGGYPVQKKVGMIAGMSGSPVYVNGHLLGAISYGWPFSKEPIAGVTPIETMLAELGGKRVGSAESPWKTSRALNPPILLGRQKYKRVELLKLSPKKSECAKPETIYLSPVATLLQVRGLSGKSLARLAKALDGFEILPLQAGGGVEASSIPPLVPGSAVGIQLVKGDLEISGTGTLTWREGNRFLAFGHPFAQLGEIDIPLTASMVHEILPSYSKSFKFVSQIGIVGTLLQDRLFAISGVIHKMPTMIPVTLEVTDRSRGQRRAFHFKALQHKFLTPVILENSIIEGLSAVSPVLSDSTAIVSYEICPKGLPELKFRDMVSSSTLDEDVAEQFFKYLKPLVFNDLEKVTLKKVAIRVEVVPQKRIATLGRVFASRSRYRPGETIELGVEIRPYGKEPVTRKFSIPLPPEIRKGSIRLGVSGGRDIERLKKKMFITDPVPTTVRQILRQLEENEKNQNLAIKAIFPREVSGICEERLPFLPSSLADVFSASPYSSIHTERDLYSHTEELPWIVAGSEMLSVTVGEDVEEEVNKKPPSLPELPRFPGVPQSSREIEPFVLPPVDVKEPRKEKETGAKEEEAGKEAKPAPGEAKVTPSGTKKWVLRSWKEFSQGSFEGTALSSNGEISLGPELQILHRSDQPFLWTLAGDPNGALYAAQGTDGRIFRIDGSLRVEEVARTQEVFITAMALDDSGDLFFASAPRGTLYRLKRGDKPEVIHKTREPYIWAILPEAGGKLLFATGGPGRIYELGSSGKTRLFFDSSEFHIRCLASDRNGNLFAGTANHGLILKIDSAGKGSVLFCCQDPSVDSLLLLPDGGLMASSGIRIYRLTPEGVARTYELPDGPVLSLAKDGDGNIYAGTGVRGRIYKLTPEGKIIRLIENICTSILSLRCGAGGELVAASAGPAQLLLLKASRASMEGRYVSPVLDAEKISQWGNLRWQASVPEGARLTFQSRSGDSLQPDSSWSPWSPEYTLSDGQSILSPPGRFIQIKANIVADSSGKSPILRETCLFYRNKAQAPQLRFLRPLGGERISETEKIKWKADSPNLESLGFDISYSPDEGHTWKEIKKDLKPSLPKQPVEGKKGASGDEASCTWNTASLKDGWYIVRIRAYDRTCRENMDLTAEIVSNPVLVCNTPPKIVIISHRTSKGMFHLKGIVKSKLLAPLEVVCRIDQGTWEPALPADGIFDSPMEEFIYTTAVKSSQDHQIEIRATDEAGNKTTISKRI